MTSGRHTCVFVLCVCVVCRPVSGSADQSQTSMFRTDSSGKGYKQTWSQYRRLCMFPAAEQTRTKKRATTSPPDQCGPHDNAADLDRPADSASTRRRLAGGERPFVFIRGGRSDGAPPPSSHRLHHQEQQVRGRGAEERSDHVSRAQGRLNINQVLRPSQTSNQCLFPSV